VKDNITDITENRSRVVVGVRERLYREFTFEELSEIFEVRGDRLYFRGDGTRYITDPKSAVHYLLDYAGEAVGRDGRVGVFTIGNTYRGLVEKVLGAMKRGEGVRLRLASPIYGGGGGGRMVQAFRGGPVVDVEAVTGFPNGSFEYYIAVFALKALASGYIGIVEDGDITHGTLEAATEYAEGRVADLTRVIEEMVGSDFGPDS